jgi:1,4-dihydroxy-6-naphthoate synthase
MAMNLKTHHDRYANLSLGFSPCPNDTFMFDALVHEKIDTEGLHFNVVMEDVETLNLKADQSMLDVTKLSFAAFTHLTEKYQLLNSGSAIGKGVGPLVISKNMLAVGGLENETLRIAVPGKNTTANFLFTLFFPKAKNKAEIIFSDIENAVLSGDADAGVIIHENRFTYEKKGLKKVCDLGELWEKETGHAIPLGGIAVRRSLPQDVKEKIDRVLRRSIAFAFANPDSGRSYVKAHAQEMEEEVMRRHIETYVNDFSLDLGVEGKSAIHFLFQKAMEAGMIASMPQNIFISQHAHV